MSDEIKPALQPHEWDGGETWYPIVALRTTNGGAVSVWDGKITDDSQFVTVPNDYRHALAALALHGQSFGFTHEDVTLLRDVLSGPHDTAIEEDEGHSWEVSCGEDHDARTRRLDLAARIAALLPPP